MSDPSFGPIKNSAKPPPKTGQLVTIGTALFVLQARYTSPIDGADKPLPRHRWTLIGARDGTAVVAHVGTTSDADGMSSIGASNDMNDPDITWHLSWQPAFDDPADLKDWTTSREAWIDLDKKPNDKDAWVGTRRLNPIEQRRLIRMPVWTSTAKARNGNFNETPNAGFAATGSLSAADIAAKLLTKDTFGTRTKPWLVMVDFNWFRSFLHFRFFDHKKKDESIIAPGLVVRAVQGNGSIVGGGTAIDPEGTIFVLHERTKEDSKRDVDYQFETPASFTIMDLDAAAPTGRPPAANATDRRVVKVDKLPDGGPRRRYLLPVAWHSKGMQAFLEGVSPRARRASAELRGADTTLARPLAFHLDDVVLFDAAVGIPVFLPTDSRVVLFDHRLAFRGPFDAQLVNVLQEKISGAYLRAEDLFVTKGQEFRDSTFVVHHEGDFFVLREGRITGNLGKNLNVGARVAAARSPENPIGDFRGAFPNMSEPGMCQLHFLPDAYDGPYEEAREGEFLKHHPTAKLGHVLVVIPVAVTSATVGTAAIDAPTPGDVVPPAGIPPILQALREAGERWDQAHPAHGATGKKDYVVTPAAGVKDGTRVIKLRHYFAVRRDSGQALTISATFRNQLTSEGKRSFVSADRRSMSLVLSPRPPAAPSFSDPKAAGKDSDGFALGEFTLAHELGHVMALPDEYTETLDFPAVPGRATPEGRTEPRIPRFGQAHDGYPFSTDREAMMRGNQLPRLRYLWHHVDALLNNGAARSLLPEGPYVAQYSAFARGITFQIPEGNATNPWQPLAQTRGPAGRSNLVLYRSGDDEATVERVFPRPASLPVTPGGWLQGILVVTPKIWFNFLASGAGDFKDDVERFKLMITLHENLYSKDLVMRHRFMIEGAASLRLPRIALLFQPRMELGTRPNFESGFAGSRVTESDADVVIDVVFQDGKPKPAILPRFWPRSTKPRLQINAQEAALNVLRFALGIPAVPAPDNGLLTALELAPLAGFVSNLLADPPGSPPRLIRNMP